jgi:hypothetical protein
MDTMKPIRVRTSYGRIGHAYRAIAGGTVVAEPDHVFVVWPGKRPSANRYRTNELWRTRDGENLARVPEVTAIYGA